MDNRSISQEVIAIIRRYLAQPAASADARPDDEAIKLAGSWVDERSAKEISREIRAARRIGKRFNGAMLCTAD